MALCRSLSNAMPKTPEERAAYARQWRIDNPDKVKAGIARSLAKRKADWDDFLAGERRRYQGKKDEVNSRQKRYRKEDPERRAAVMRRYAENHPEKMRELWAGRRAAKRKAMPAWVSRDEITAIYENCIRITNETGVLHEVDHIVPLQGKGVCGLHVPWNLRVITRAENRAKGASVCQW